ncbi:16S rRNA (uracil(1498)-N(3))-methyltransferase [Thioalkalivibrio sp. HK1]|uniref:16S rRNA (uracil(1498)-N(3))-methyltransferase n=1 Tax=Thioalkalivibrio sp. HK1 TaxID=1469245 RepID=UPI000471F4DC|nr:16S rRNA (uracil(1498)-N(3))-methyltransferase [Thioalkalivibrio sp. HK1]
MPVPRFHVDAELDSGREIVLPAAVSRHATRTLRLEEGDPIIVFDGRSDFEYDATIVASVVSRPDRPGRGGGVKAVLGAARAVASESPLQIELVQGLCKGERMDFVVQKATELGVCAIHPLLCERSVSRPDPGRAKRRIEHWQGVAIHAAQQSGRVRIPVIAELQVYEDWMAKGGSSGFFLHPEAKESPSEVDMTGFEGSDLDPEKSLRVIVGPEGGFSQREVERAQEAGYRGLRLGPRILRTETAGLVAIALLQARLGDLG